MSRAHMLYSNSALTSLPVKLTTWQKAWNADQVFKRKSGNGIIIEGIVQTKSRHTIVDGANSNLKFRYVAIYVKVLDAVRRKFDINGKEIEPDFGSKKIALTGYLSSKTVSKEGEDVLPPESVVEMLKINELETINKEKACSLNIPNLVSIWCEEKELEGMELEDNALVRLRTKGDGPYLDSLTCLDNETSRKVNYTTGEHLGASWTDKVLNVKDEKEDGAHLTEDSSAIDDNEWDD